MLSSGMIELAMAEAYRPRKPKKKKTSLIGCESRAGSVPSTQSSSAMSLKSLFQRTDGGKRHIGSAAIKKEVFSDRGMELKVERVDMEKGRGGSAPTPITKSHSPSIYSQLSLPNPASLPDDDLSDFDSAISSACHDLSNDFTLGARQLADASLKHLVHITDIAACTATSWGEYWAMIVHTAKHLTQARPSMSAAIISCLLRALAQVAQRWNEEQAAGRKSTADLARIAGGTLDEVLHERKQLSVKLGFKFTEWLKNYSSNHTSDSPRDNPPSIRILTLSNSSTIRTALLSSLSTLQHLHLHLTILESRPRCDGADMAAQILSSARTQHNDHRLSIRILPDCAVGTAARNGGIDIVLLGADCISSKGDVSNKIGSLAAALCAKQAGGNVAVVVVSDGDKIAARGREEGVVERHPAHELSSAWAPDTRCQLEGKVEVFGEWFEWVPGELVDVYVTELGVLSRVDVERVAGEIGELEEFIFKAQGG